MTSSRGVSYARTADGLDIAYSTRGSGPPVLFLGEIGASHAGMIWDSPVGKPLLDRIAESNQVVAVDPRNHGLSTRGVQRLSVDDHLLDIDAVASAISAPRISLCAFGNRAKVAAHYTAENPDRVSSLVLIGPAIGRVDENAGYQEIAAVYPLARVNWSAFTDVFAVLLWGLSDPERTVWWASFVRASVDGDDYRHTVAALASADLTEQLGRVAARTLIVLGEGSWFSLAEAQRIATSMPDATVASVPGERTWDAPELGTTVAAFLRDGGTDASVAASRTPRIAFSTILFTDVVSSTPLLSQLKDERMREVMHDHDAVCAAAIAEHGGRVVKTIGDAFMAEFSVPSSAIEAAIAIQRGIREQFADSDVPVRLRIGINAGEPIAEGDDLHGASVVIAKRLESAAETGGILVSDVVRQAVAGKDFEFEDRGEVELKGFDQPVRAWAVRSER